jgi:hypothetical protein
LLKETMRAAAFCAALLSASVAHAAGYLVDGPAEAALVKTERAWMAQYAFAPFRTPGPRGPAGPNPPAVRSVSPATITRTDLVAAGRPKPQTVTGGPRWRRSAVARSPAGCATTSTACRALAPAIRT